MSVRSFFVVVALTLVGLVMVGCAPTPTPELIEVIVKETTIVTVDNLVEVLVTATPGPKPDVAATIRIDSLSESGGRNFVEMVVKPFAEELGVEIEVELGTYGSQDEWLSSVRAAPGEHCIALYISDFGLYNGAKQGLLQPFRLENMPNYDNLADKWANRVIVPGDENAYVAIVDVGMYESPEKRFIKIREF